MTSDNGTPSSTGVKEKENNASALQRWVIQPSHKDTNFDEDNSHSSASSTSSTASDIRKHTPKKAKSPNGILRFPDTPGTGQSVRFGKRLYDDGDESRMSSSTASSSYIGLSTSRTGLQEDLSEDAVNLSLGFARPMREHNSPNSDESEMQETESPNSSAPASPTLQASKIYLEDGQGSLDTVALPNLEGYSNLEDISFDFGAREDTTIPTFRRAVQPEISDISADESFNESFLQAEMELAKRQMEEENGKAPSTVTPLAKEGQQDVGQLVEDSEGLDTSIVKGDDSHSRVQSPGTPADVNTTQASDYLSTRSQASYRSSASTIAEWSTPDSLHLSPTAQRQEGDQTSEASAERRVTDESETQCSLQDVRDESPSVSRVKRGLKLRMAGAFPSPISEKLQALANTPSKRSPLSEIVCQFETPSGIRDKSGSPSPSVQVSLPGEAHKTEVTSASRSSTPHLQGPLTEDVFRHTQELDQVHTERSSTLLEWAREAELDAHEARQMLREEQEKTGRAVKEAQMAQSQLDACRKEQQELDAQRKDRMQDLESLIAKLHGQLDQQSRSISDRPSEALRRAGSEEEKHQSTECGNNEIGGQNVGLSGQDVSFAQGIGAREDRSQTEDKEAQLEARIQDITPVYEARLQESLAAQQRLQDELNEVRYSFSQQEQVDTMDKDRALLEDQSSLRRALEAAQSQIKYLQGHENSDSARLRSLHDDLEKRQEELRQGQAAVKQTQEDLEEERNQRKRSGEEHLQYVNQVEADKRQLEKKARQMEEENNNLLQSLAEVEEHRRAMEEDLLSKRDTIMQDSRLREEKALALADEMQSQLQKLEEKLEKAVMRTTMLEREVGDRGLEIVKLEKAKERLEEDNLNYSIALASKQQELSLLKRNTNRNQRNTPASATSGRLTSTYRQMTTVGRSSMLSSSAKQEPLSETQIADESGSSLPPLQSGPSVAKIMRRKTMDVDEGKTTAARSVVGGQKVDAAAAMAMPPPSKANIRTRRAIGAEVETTLKASLASARTAGRASLQSSRRNSADTALPAAEMQSVSRQSSSSSLANLQGRKPLTASIVASEGPMDISELQSDQDAVKMRTRELQNTSRPSSMVIPPSRSRSNLNLLAV